MCRLESKVTPVHNVEKVLFSFMKTHLQRFILVYYMYMFLYSSICFVHRYMAHSLSHYSRSLHDVMCVRRLYQTYFLALWAPPKICFLPGRTCFLSPTIRERDYTSMLLHVSSQKNMFFWTSKNPHWIWFPLWLVRSVSPFCQALLPLIFYLKYPLHTFHVNKQMWKFIYPIYHLKLFITHFLVPRVFRNVIENDVVLCPTTMHLHFNANKRTKV